MRHERKAPSARGDVAKVLRPASRALLLGLLLLHAPALLAQGLTFTHFAGTTGGWGYFDGPASEASFADPAGVAIDAAGNIYVADYWNFQIRKVSPSGKVTTLAGLPAYSPRLDGRGGAAGFGGPAGIAVDSLGNVYVADDWHQAVRKISPTGDVTTLLEGYSFSPAAVAVDRWGAVYVADMFEAWIYRISPDGRVTPFAGRSLYGRLLDSPGSDARFGELGGIAVDANGFVYVADREGHNVAKITSEGVVSSLAGSGLMGTEDGIGSAARFLHPTGIAVDAAGNVFVTDEWAATIRKITADGVVTTLAGLAYARGSTDGTGSAARFNVPWGLTIDGGGNLFVADSSNGTIRKVTQDGVVTTVVGRPAAEGTDDGAGSSARFFTPVSAAFDGAGDLFVVDSGAHTIRKVSPDGTVSTLAGLAGVSGTADGTGSAARFNYPASGAVDPSGRLVVADEMNHAIRVVTSSGEVSTLAGLPGSAGAADGVGSAARFYQPKGIGVDAAGIAYVAEYWNHSIRKVTAAGKVTTLAGGMQGSADGVGTAARFNRPTGVAVTPDGVVYVADDGNRTIRRVAQDGTVTTLAGLAGAAGNVDGTGTAARFERPYKVALDVDGNLVVSDRSNYLLRKVTPSGTVTTLGGQSWFRGVTDGTGTAARFRSPAGIAVSPGGDLFVADSGCRCIRRGSLALPDVATIDSTTGPVGQARQLGVSPQTGYSWRWELVRRPTGSSAVLTSTTIPNPTFTPDVPDTYLFRLTTSDGIRTSITTVPLTASVTALVSGAAAICAGGSAAVKATLTGTPPWTLTWSDGFVQSDVTASPVTRTVSPLLTTTYTVTKVSDADGPGSATGSATVVVSGPAPSIAPVISAPLVAGAGSWYRLASVVANPGSSYYWTITNGTIVAGQGSSVIHFRTGSPGTLQLGVVEVTPGGCPSPTGYASVSVAPAGTATAFYSIPACRLVDSRLPGVRFGGQPIPSGGVFYWSVRDACGVPSGARAVSANVTATEPTASGFLTVYFGYVGPGTSTLNFQPGRTLANNVILNVPSDLYYLRAYNASPGTVHVIIDVNGFFQ